ncbi:MAG: peptidoglycan D,D-transpeptidase FtsI family protein, partial [Anaeroplasma sp.]
MNRRIFFIIIFFFFLFTALILKLGYITFYQSNKINILAYDLWSREIPVETSRGLILDRNGNVIVGNELAYTVCSINRQIDNKESTAKIISEILECDYNKILKHLKKNNSLEIIKPEGRRITYQQALDISKANLDGIYITYDNKRYYPYGNTLGSVLGFCGVDMEGLSGVEYMYNDYLKGQNGALAIYTDAKGNLMHDMISEYKNSTPGMNVYLTIDIELQKIMDGVINKAVELYDPNQVMGIMVSAKTGEILGMTSYPYFDPLNYQDYDPEIYNRILPIFNQFELGSTFKIITYSAALEEGLFDLNDRIYCSGSTVVADRKIRCWKSGGHGSQTFLEGIQNSCNVCFMELGRRLGVEKFYEYLEKFGMTSKTGIDLQGEGSPIIVKKNNCGPVELATQAFGQSSAYTPIQLSMAAIAAVNGGQLLKPYILKQLETFTGEIVFEKERIIKTNPISPKTSNLMRYALECVCALGTGRNAFIEGYRVGGKTG